MAEIDKERKVVELGCGIGRVAAQFDPEEYIGVDLCDRFLEIARRKLPSHTLLKGPLYPEAEIYLVHTVFLHLTDEEVRRELRGIRPKTKAIFIGEIMVPSFANHGEISPVGVMCYNRSPEDYDILLAEEGFKREYRVDLPYDRYGDGVDFTYLLYK